MIVRAASSKARQPASGSRTLLKALAGLLSCAVFASPCAAQVAGSVGIDSDYRLRGYSLTDDHPALTGQLTYDDPSGLYVSVSGLTELSSDTKFLGVIGNIGYARRINPHLTLDGGLLRSQIGASVQGSPGFKYTEVYAGAYVGPVSGRIYYSPDYRVGGLSTIYAELEAGFEPLPDWRLSGHLGLLTYLSSAYFYRSGDTHSDVRISLGRQFGRIEVHAAVSRGGPDTYYGNRIHRGTAVTLGSSLSF